MAFHSLLFMEVDNTRTELQDLQQGIANNCEFNEILKNISGELWISSTSILGSQEFNILYNNQGIESMTSIMIQRVDKV